MNRRNALGKPAGVRAPFVSFVLLVAPPYLILSPDPPCSTPGNCTYSYCPVLPPGSKCSCNNNNNNYLVPIVVPQRPHHRLYHGRGPLLLLHHVHPHGAA